MIDGSRTVSRPGYTLIELVLVLALLVILAAVTAPKLDSLYGTFRVTAAADSVRAAWAQARAHAVNEGCPYRFAIQTGRYRLAPDAPGYWADAGPNSLSTSSSEPPLVQEVDLPQGVELMAGSGAEVGGDAAGWTTVATFLPDGTARPDVELSLRAPGARPLVMRLRGLTGAVSTRRPAMEGP